MLRFVSLCVFALITAPALLAQTPNSPGAASPDTASPDNVSPDTAQDKELRDRLSPLIQEHEGDVGVAIKNLKTGEVFGYHADQVMPTASLIKLPLMVAVYREVDSARLDLGKVVMVKDSDKVPGSGVLTNHFSQGVQLPLRDIVRLMIRYSDNTATNIVIDQVGLLKTSQAAQKLGCPNTKLHSKLYRRDTSIFPERSKQYGIGSTTAAEIVSLLEQVHAGAAATPAACEAMMGHLRECEDRSMIGRHLPKSMDFAHKTGAIANCRTDAGIIFTASGPIAVCVLTNKNKDQRWSDDNAAELLIAEVGKAIVQRFASDDKSQEPDLDLRKGAFGRMVETLQRTLNARLQPSPGLAIDGDFGPATESSVIRFQEANELTENGIVTPEVWKALGTLIEHDAPVLSPEIVNKEVLAVADAPNMDAPPIVTCDSWVIGDSESGEVFFRSDSDEPRQAASTTKIMTALVVFEYAKKNPGLLDEVITFSKVADNTVGSTSAVRAGEKVTVHDLLYGLLLPSGNDASVALAEHIGGKLTDKESGDGYMAFVDLMNATAKRLEMKNTHYKNTHGLSDREHLTTAKDLLVLASHAIKHSLFRKIVGTRQFGVTLKSVKGYKRDVVWKNTNQLLGIDGYSGIKTGTTTAAGACLVSHGERNGVALIAVVLGSSSSAARYADTRNLLRWAWGRRKVE